MKIRIEMPKSAGYHGTRDVEFPAVPRIGETIKDANNRYYIVESVTYTPFEREDVPRIEIGVREGYGTSASAVMEGRECFEK